MNVYDVVVASRPGEPMILDALNSIFEQTMGPARVVIVMDDDEPLPMGWWQAISATFPTVELLLNPGRGMASATGAGIRHASSAYVAFLDTDDLWMPEKQAHQVGALELNTELHAATCLARNVQIPGEDYDHQSPAFPCATFTATTFRTEAFHQFGFPDPGADHHAWLYRWWSQARFNGIRSCHVPYFGLERRIHGANSWCVDNEAAHRSLLRELKAIITHRREAPALPSSKTSRATNARIL